MIKFGTLGAARITPPALVTPCAEEKNASIEVIGASSRSKAESFAKKYDIPTVVEGYAEVISHPAINAVYLPLPINAHYEWACLAMQAGKHVLCEKSFSSNAEEAELMAEESIKTGMVLMDAFHYRYHPIFLRARQIVEEGHLGEIKEVRADFHVPVTDPSDIRMNYATAGGVTMDIGCYPISWVRHILSLEPLEVKATAIVGPPDVDVYLQSEMIFEGNIKAITTGDMRDSARFRASIVVEGEKGSMEVLNPIAPHMGNEIKFEIEGVKTSETFTKRSTYNFQLDAFIAAVEKGEALYTDASDAVLQMRVIDRCYKSAGLPLRGLGSVL